MPQSAYRRRRLEELLRSDEELGHSPMDQRDSVPYVPASTESWVRGKAAFHYHFRLLRSLAYSDSHLGDFCAYVQCASRFDQKPKVRDFAVDAAVMEFGIDWNHEGGDKQPVLVPVRQDAKPSHRYADFTVLVGLVSLDQTKDGVSHIRQITRHHCVEIRPILRKRERNTSSSSLVPSSGSVGDVPGEMIKTPSKVVHDVANSQRSRRQVGQGGHSVDSETVVPISLSLDSDGLAFGVADPVNFGFEWLKVLICLPELSPATIGKPTHDD